MSFFQLRLKRETLKKKIIIGEKIKKICKKFNVKFLINDDVFIAKKLNAKANLSKNSVAEGIINNVRKTRSVQGGYHTDKKSICF